MSSIDDYHAEIKRKIEVEKAPGYAQSMVGVPKPEGTPKNFRHLAYPGEVLASYDTVEFVTAFEPYTGMPSSDASVAKYRDMVLDIASGEGIASAAVFSRSKLIKQIADYEGHNSNFSHLHKAAAGLRAFYLDGGPGVHHLK